mmetsp:Transcript_27281/g.65751  ORF Transcript_27281/g.65751 Transcript_27281/m.65751 type:complete len:501 (+) Transcript_27281:47-1549(+)
MAASRNRVQRVPNKPLQSNPAATLPLEEPVHPVVIGVTAGTVIDMSNWEEMKGLWTRVVEGEVESEIEAIEARFENTDLMMTQFGRIAEFFGMDRKTANRLFTEMDDDRSGAVTWEEFLECFRRHRDLFNLHSYGRPVADIEFAISHVPVEPEYWEAVVGALQPYWYYKMSFVKQVVQDSAETNWAKVGAWPNDKHLNAILQSRLNETILWVDFCCVPERPPEAFFEHFREFEQVVRFSRYFVVMCSSNYLTTIRTIYQWGTWFFHKDYVNIIMCTKGFFETNTMQYYLEGLQVGDIEQLLDPAKSFEMPETLDLIRDVLNTNYRSAQDFFVFSMESLVTFVVADVMRRFVASRRDKEEQQERYQRFILPFVHASKAHFPGLHQVLLDLSPAVWCKKPPEDQWIESWFRDAAIPYLDDFRESIRIHEQSQWSKESQRFKRAHNDGVVLPTFDRADVVRNCSDLVVPRKTRRRLPAGLQSGLMPKTKPRESGSDDEDEEDD